MKKNSISTFSIVIVIIILAMLFSVNKIWKKDNKVIAWDVVHYYAYLPASFIYHDLTLEFTENYQGEHKFTIWYKPDENGNKVIKTSMGMSILYSPFFVLGHVTAYILDYDTGGYSLPYKFWLVIGTFFYLIIGLIFLRKILLQFFSDKISAITIFSIFAATNLLYYSYFEATMSHAYNFSLFSIFIYLTIEWHKNPNVTKSILIGILTGLITLIRPTNVLITIFFILYNIIDFETFKAKLNTFIKKYYLLLIIMLFAFLVFVPQMLYWHKVTGYYLFFSYGSDENFFFLKPQIINGLFSYRKGWLIYTPIMIFSLFGIVNLLKNKELKKFFIPILFFLLLNIYIIYSWWSWWYGGGFGSRAMIDAYAILSIPFAAFLKWIYNSKKQIKIIFSVVFVIFILHGIFQNIQYYYGAIHWDSMTKEAYWDSFLRAKPSSKFKSLLAEPDYEKAKFGIQDVIIPEIEEIDEKKIDIKEKIICDVENVDTINQLIKSNNDDINFLGTTAVSNEFAYSGKNSIKLNEKNPFGLTITLNNLKSGEKYFIKVKKYSPANDGFLVIQAENSADFYFSESLSNKIVDSKWTETSHIFVVPEKLNDKKVKIYCYNPSKKDVYFDDFEINYIKSSE